MLGESTLKAGPATTRELAEAAANGSVSIPEFQREFVWKPKQVELFCDSLINGFPVGSLTLWKHQQETTAPLWVIDGQQRLTSICIMYDKRPQWMTLQDWTSLTSLYNLFLNVDASSGHKRVSTRQGKQSLSVAISRILACESINDTRDLIRSVLDDYPNKYTASARSSFDEAVQQIWNVREAKIPFQLVEFNDPINAAEAYMRLNETGTRVREPDVYLGFIAVYNPGWVGNTLRPFLRALDNAHWSIAPGDILRAMTIVYNGSPRPGEIKAAESKQFWQQAPVVFERLRQAITDIRPRLERYGITSTDILPSKYALVALLALHACWASKLGYDFDRSFKWFLLVNLTGRYGVAPLEMLSADAKAIYGSQTWSEAIEKLNKLAREAAPGGIDITQVEALQGLLSKPFRKNTPEALLLRSLLWTTGALDWQKGGPLSTYPPLEWHHIVPKKICERSGLQRSDSIGNLTLLSSDANKVFKDAPPWQYGKERIREVSRLTSHFVPQEFAERFLRGESISTQAEFDAFLEDRIKLIAAKAAQFLA